MGWNFKTLVLTTALTISASALGPIIELPSNYDRKSPWKELAALNLTNLTETDCQRPCIAGEPPRVCLYTFVFEYYAAMGTACGNCSQGVMEDCFRSQCIPADGYERGVMSLNRMIPGPAIHICKYDLLMVLIDNKMETTETTIHWHGILQKHSQWMDGVPYLTQCPIGYGKFRYVFPVEDAGTFLYHGHSEFHRTNGQYGALIVRRPRPEDAWSEDVYDFDLPEHTMVISDWMHETAEMFFPGLPTRKPGILPTSFLINGLGRYLNRSDDDSSFNVRHPLAHFHVKRNNRYRFRIINAGSHICPVLLQIEDHPMTLITTDGEPVKQTTVDAIAIYPGERYDVVINTINFAGGKNAFWIHLRGLGVCESINKVNQYAVLSYDTEATELDIVPEGSRPTIENPLPINTLVNLANTTCGVSPNRLCVSDLTSLGREDNMDILTAKPDVRLFIDFNFHQYTNVSAFHEKGNYLRFMNIGGTNIRSAVMNNISFMFPYKPSLFSRDGADLEFCTPDDLPAECRSQSKDLTTPYCECPHFVTIKKDAIVEMTLIDLSDSPLVNHPMHLHGHSFYVVDMGKDFDKSVAYRAYQREKLSIVGADEAPTSSSHMPAFKDTVSVPPQGYATVRWKANNPGDWLFHCHFEWHMHVGMMMAFRVLGNIAPEPPGFPKCHDFDPLRDFEKLVKDEHSVVEKCEEHKRPNESYLPTTSRAQWLRSRMEMFNSFSNAQSAIIPLYRNLSKILPPI